MTSISSFWYSNMLAKMTNFVSHEKNSNNHNNTACDKTTACNITTVMIDTYVNTGRKVQWYETYYQYYYQYHKYYWKVLYFLGFTTTMLICRSFSQRLCFGPGFPDDDKRWRLYVYKCAGKVETSIRIWRPHGEESHGGW